MKIWKTGLFDCPLSVKKSQNRKQLNENAAVKQWQVKDFDNNGTELFESSILTIRILQIHNENYQTAYIHEQQSW
jgi:hypothetical protein